MPVILGSAAWIGIIWLMSQQLARLTDLLLGSMLLLTLWGLSDVYYLIKSKIGGSSNGKTEEKSSNDKS